MLLCPVKQVFSFRILYLLFFVPRVQENSFESEACPIQVSWGQLGGTKNSLAFLSIT